VINNQQMQLADFISRFYLSPKGIVLKSFIPKKIIKRKNPEGLNLKSLENKKQKLKKPILLWQEERKSFYKKQIKKNNQVLFLVPEKTLLKKYYSWAKEIDLKTEIFHGQIKEAKAFEIFKNIASNKTKIIVGTRAALFLPFSKLSLIVLEKEESLSYKSWDLNPKYHSKSVALKLAQLSGAQIILGTSMPSVESFYFAKEKQYKLIKKEIKQEAKISIIDMKEEREKGNYSLLSDQLRKEIENSEQTIIFNNRKGLATSMRCKDCGHIIKCSECDIPMVFHKKFNNKKNVLVCHHCLKTMQTPSVCPKCKSREIKLSGSGTQKMFQELKGFKAVIFDKDSVPKKNEQKKLLKEFKEKKYNILITTQLILGYLHELKKDFYLGAIISADRLMNIPEYRASENFFHLIFQLRRISTKLLIQTYNKDSELFNTKTEDFYNQEIKNRKLLNYPPFCKIIKLGYLDFSIENGKKEALDLKTKLEKYIPEIKVMGPSLALVPKVKNKYLWHLIIKINKKDYNKAQIIRQLAKEKWMIDVEPISLN
ncbi:MAG: primosomal protein N', partial [Elusimicrobiota bacterium]|nr:primosomal protein N' [Elusimicrobiota bacterium]